MDELHSLADKRSRALHEAVALRLTEQPELLSRARRRVQEWLGDPSSHPYALDWKALLDGPLAELIQAMTSTSPRMCTLRQASPFAGALDNRTRWAGRSSRAWLGARCFSSVCHERPSRVK